LLRVLEAGEYIKVGSSKVQKTDVRVVAATNINFHQALEKGKFRADLYYRLNTVPIYLPPLRERKEDIHLLFRKFANDFAAKYKMPVVKLNHEAEQVLVNYFWPGNIRQLKNITEQISIIEKSKEVNAEILLKYLPQYSSNNVPSLVTNTESGFNSTDRDLIFKVVRDMKTEILELKKVVYDLMSAGGKINPVSGENVHLLNRIYTNEDINENAPLKIHPGVIQGNGNGHTIEVEETLSLQDKEIDMIKKALRKHKGKRKYAAKELGISERTLYRKINEYHIEE
jgi:transcriptional regulator with PAS, ATPase and Fis domain